MAASPPAWSNWSSSLVSGSSVASWVAPPGWLSLTDSIRPSGATASCVSTVWHCFLPE